MTKSSGTILAGGKPPEGRDAGKAPRKVAEVMTQAPVTVRSDSTLEEAAQLMIQTRVSGLPVVDGTGSVVGMITEGDLLRRAELGTAGPPTGWLASFVAPGRAAQSYIRTHGQRISDVMTKELIFVSPETLLSEVVTLMESRHVKRLPVLERGHLVGIVSRADLLRALAQLLTERHVGAISDAELRQRVLAEISKEHWAPRMNVDCTVENGVVELRGAVTDDRERVGLRVIAESVPGVRGVHDRLIWVDPMSGTVVDFPKE
jgi:CBS domain-containing protein